MRVIFNHLSQFSLMHIPVLFFHIVDNLRVWARFFARCLCFVFSVMKRMLYRRCVVCVFASTRYVFCCFRRGSLPSTLLKRPNVPIHHGSVMVVGRKSIHRQHPWRLPNPSGTLGGPIVSICTLGGYQSPAAPLEVNTSPIRRLRYVLRRFARSPP